jgi:hypothetical protein
MKNNLYLKMVLLVLGSTLMAQESDPKFKVGIGCFYARASTTGQSVLPTITLTRGKHVFFAGPALYYLNDENPRPLTGANLGYQFFPNGRQNRFNLFLEYDFTYMEGTTREKPSYNWYSASSYKIHIVDISNYLGFGFRLNIIKNLYLNAGAGVGILPLYKDEYFYESPNGEFSTGKGSLVLRELQFYHFFKFGLCLDLIKVRSASKKTQTLN